MKQLLFLFLFPCLAMAQYPGNAGQKITLGEQTTADGLVYRGVANDTALITPLSDTSAYIILDTVNNKFFHYKRNTNVWSVAGGSGTVTSVAALTLGTTGTDLSSTVATGTTTPFITLNVPNASATARGVVTIGTQTFGGVKIFSEFKVDNPSNTQLTINTNGNLSSVGAYFVFSRKNVTRWVFGLSPYFATNDFEINPKNAFPAFTIKDSTGQFEFRTIPDANNGTERMRITSAGEVWIGYTTDNGAYPLQVNGQIFATNATIAPSDEKFKENITPLNKGLEIVSKLKPVTFNFISDTKNNFSEYEEVGFIAQDVDRALSTETFSKSIVKSADDSEPTSTMGLATQNLIPILVKAIQEQQALIKALEQRIINLENK